MIIVRLSGGLGNQMFQYALGRFLSLKNNVPLKLDTAFLKDRTPRSPKSNFVFRNYDLDIFNIKAEIAKRNETPPQYRFYFSGKLKLLLDGFRRKFWPNLGKEKKFSFQPEILLLGSNVYLDGYWQSPKYFENISDVIRNDFTLKNDFSKKVRKLMEEISSCQSLCVNIRRSDFVTSNFHGFMDKDYYDRAIAYLSEFREIEKIFVFSDDIEWCRQNLEFSYPTIFVGHEYAGEKFGNYLYLMSSCKNFIIPNSSFAWWSAWLNMNADKTVIVPKKWFLQDNIDTDDLIPNNWVRV